MRIHRIELQAFGPFAGRETVDLEPLNEAGLFLLDGPTGAGKSTVLAAVCFALYGTLPGQRSADSLASTHALPGTRPEVLLEVTLGGRRFEILRWPRHQRPRLRRSKDGSALTEEKAGAQLRELRDGQWTEVSVRADEIGQLLRTVLPLDSEQFMHVVMLPQGEFARFLRADSKDKETLLRRLFGTGRFDHVEQHLAARHQALADAVRQDLQLTERLRAEIDEALTDHGGPDWDAAAEDAENSEDVGDAQDRTSWTDEQWVLRARTAAERAVGAAQADVASARQGAAEARETLEQLEERRSALLAAQSWDDRDARHRAAAELTEDHRSRLDRHRVAAPLVRRAEEVDRARAHANSARLAWVRALDVAREDDHVRSWDRTVSDDSDAEESLSAVQAESTTARLRRVLRLADRAIDALEQHAEDDRRAEEIEQVLDQAAEEDRKLAERSESLEASLRRGEEQTEVLQSRSEQLTGTAAGLARAVEAAAQASTRVTAARGVAELEDATVAAANSVRAATDSAQDARQIWLDLVQRRLDNAALLLAAELEPAQACPVCGATEHPAPAGRGPVSRGLDDADEPQGAGALDLSSAAQERAHAVWREAESVRDQAQLTLDEQRRQLTDRRLVAAGLSLHEAEQQASMAEADRQRAEHASAELEQVRRELQELEDRRTEQRAQLDRLRTSRAQLQTRDEHLTLERDGLRRTISATLNGRPSLTALRQELLTARARVDTAVSTGETVVLAEAAESTSQDSLSRELTGAGYETLDQARGDLVNDDARLDLTEAVRTWDHERAALAELSSSAAVVAGQDLLRAGMDVPEMERIEQARVALQEASQREQSALSASGSVTALRQQVDRQCRALEAAGERSAGQRARTVEVEELLKLVRGSGENEYHMRLASYVLTGRLEDVALAATERLLSMTDGRYELIHDDSGSGGSRRRGLDLVVRDLYTDTVRAASSLSGGETFMASLALALGLADTVQAEAGGVEMDTLFVDEGFGSLDAQTLEQVMDVLDGLQAGGRTLGLVSHVDQMRQEIPCRLEVTKTRQGSHLQVVLPDGGGGYPGQHAS